MFYRIITTAVVIMSSVIVKAEDPRLFIGVNVGSSLLSISPPVTKNNQITPLTRLLGGNASNTASYEKQALLETSSTFNNHININPVLGMSFPVSSRIQLEGYARLDAIEKDFSVKSLNANEQTLSKITQEIGIGGSLLIRISKQYAIGPVAEAVILTNESPLFPSSTSKEHTVYEFGIQSVYQLHRYFSLALQAMTALDQNIEVDATTTANNLILDYRVAKAQVSLRLTPI